MANKKKETVVILDPEVLKREQEAGAIWKHLGKNEGARRRNAFILVVIILAAVVFIAHVAFTTGAVHFTWTK